MFRTTAEEFLEQVQNPTFDINQLNLYDIINIVQTSGGALTDILPSYIDSTLNLQNCQNLTHLPDNLEIKYYLHLGGCKNIRFLPKGLKVHGNLFMSWTNIEYLPDDLYVGGRIDYHGNPYIKVPKGKGWYDK